MPFFFFLPVSVTLVMENLRFTVEYSIIFFWNALRGEKERKKILFWKTLESISYLFRLTLSNKVQTEEGSWALLVSSESFQVFT